MNRFIKIATLIPLLLSASFGFAGEKAKNKSVKPKSDPITREEIASGEWFVLRLEDSSCVPSTEIKDIHQNPRPSLLLDLDPKCAVFGYVKATSSLVIDCRNSPTLNTSITYVRTQNDCEKVIGYLTKEVVAKAGEKILKATNKAGWIVNPRENKCFKAEGELSMARIKANNPGCFVDRSYNLADGLTVFNCDKTDIHVSLFYADTRSLCEKAAFVMKSYGVAE